MSKKISNRQRIKFKIRKKINGTEAKPRLTVYRSNKEFYAQLVDDSSSKSLLGISTKNKEYKKAGTKTEQAKSIGILLAKKALEKNIKQCVFDRNGYLFHGRVKSFTEGIKEGGLSV